MGVATLGFPGSTQIAFRIVQKLFHGKLIAMDIECFIQKCSKNARSRGMCNMHYERWRKYGDPDIVFKTGPKPGTCVGEANHNWKGDQAGLDAQHKRVTTARGNAQVCEVCGTDDPDKYYHWAFNNTGDRNNIWDYFRACVTCHRAYDVEFVPRGSGHGMSKLTEEDIPRIFAMREAGALLREIAETFSMSTTNASDILAGKAWKHVRGGDV